MISEETIVNLATKYKTNVVNVRREYFQHLFLSYFYQQPKAENIFFKGGTNLRLLYNSPRFSEDLDFNSAFINYQGIESLVLETLSQMEKENIKFSIQEGKQTSGGFLAVLLFQEFTQPVEIELQISQREEDKKGEVVAVTNDFVPTYNVVSVTEQQLVSEKIRALLERKKPRDFYDLYFILRKQVPIPDKSSVLPEVLAALRSTDAHFEAELKQFLPKSHWPIIRDFRSTLEREINKVIDKLIQL